MENREKQLATRPLRPAPQQPYRNLERSPGVVAFATGDDHISLTLHTGHSLRFTYRSAGRALVEHMKLLAHAGDGLNRFLQHEALGRHEH